MHDEHETKGTELTQERLLPGRSMDAIVAALGLLAFVLLMFLLSRLLFPVGVSLQQESVGNQQELKHASSGQELSYSGEQAADSAMVAELVTLRRNVQVKARDSLAWSDAAIGLGLSDQDSLQTLSNSGATVKLDDSSLLKVGPNSLIVFQTSAQDLFTPRRTNSIVMMEGTLSGDFASESGNPLHLEVALPNGLARFIPGDNAAAVAFNINVNPDLSSSVSVHSGKGVINVGGKTVSIDEQYGITISINGDILEEGRLPGLPEAMKPRPSAVYQYRDIPPALKFSWAAVDGVSNYRFRLARDREMNDIVIDERFPSSRFSYEGLQDGDYYWQVSSLNGYIEGPAAGPNRVSLVRDEQSPNLQLQVSEYRDGKVVVRGQTEPGAKLFIQGQATTSANGAFEKSIDIEPGTTLIVVEAVDAAGNVSYESQIVNSKFSHNGGAP